MTSLLEQLSPQHGLDIKSPRLRLRAVCPADIHPLHAIRTDPIAMKYMCVFGYQRLAKYRVD